MFFEIVGELSEVETFAIGKSIRELPRLRKTLWQGALAEAEGDRRRETPEWYYAESGASLV